MSAKVAVVVGGGPLGHATAVTLAGTGLAVVVADRGERGLADLPDGIGREVADPTDPAAAASLIARVADTVGPPGLLVNTIGTFSLGDALTVTQEGLRRMMDINLGPALWLTQAVAPHMRQQGSGIIVH